MIIVLAGFAKAQRWGTRFVDIYMNARDVNGLNKGEEIRIAGIVAGQVGTMKLNDQGVVKVKLKIEANRRDFVQDFFQPFSGQESNTIRFETYK